ncbi:SDR family oxidoreductase [Actinomadura sp. LOL_016]|uniref:SDR family oxidoreductase n=1 Tax=unclassified Actinomadura TaxID=2626254 RepID=UPI003A7F8B38
MTGRVVVVTGASAGVGRAVARGFGARGDRVVLLARGEEGLEAAAADVRELGGRALPVVADVSDPEQVEAAADRAEEEFGPIEVWVNNAFSTAFGECRQVSPQEYRRVIEVCYLGAVHGTRAALDRMVPRGTGVIVQVGSALAYRSVPLQSAYCAAKSAIRGFTESVRCELMHDRSGVAITMVQLPGLNTPQFDWVLSRLRKRAQPVPPVYQPEVAAQGVLLAADRPHRKEYWVGGATIGTLLGQRLAPALLDRYLARTAFSSQQADAREDPGRPSDLWRPLDDADDAGAHGRFDRRAKAGSLLLRVRSLLVGRVPGTLPPRAGRVGRPAAAVQRAAARRGG